MTDHLHNDAAHRTVGPVLAWARRQPRAPALSDDAGALNYGELVLAVDEAAATLRSLGLRAGDRLLGVGENSVALAVLILAASRLGVCAVLENARRAPAEIDAIVAHCQPHAMVFVHANSDDAERHATRLDAEAHSTPALGRFGVRVPAPASGSAGAEASNDASVMIYTTGSTGAPKGVMLSHANLCYIASMMQPLRQMSPQDRVYGVLPITHVMGQASVLLGTLHAGASLHLVSRFSPARCIDVLRERRITALQGAPAMFAKLVEHCHRDNVMGFPDIRFIGSGGAPIDPTVKANAEALFGTRLHNGYGLTEAASICWTRFEDENADDSVGRPLPDVEIAIVDPEQRPVVPGAVGELRVRGPNVMLGYFRNPALTAQVLTADRWFNTQDLARRGEDGRIYVVGRTKDMILRSGFNVYPLEVEAALNTHPAVLHSAVVGRVVPGNEEVVAYVELVEHADVDAAALLQHLAERLSPYKRPSHIVFVDHLPLAANGKVLKRALEALALPGIDTAEDRP